MARAAWLVLACLVCACGAVELGFPVVALCSALDAPVYNCTFRRSLAEPYAPCTARIRRFTTGPAAAPLYCSLYNTDDAASATDSYGLMRLTRFAGEAQRAALFYQLPAHVSVAEAPPANMSAVPLDVLLDLVPLSASQLTLVRILGRDAATNRYSVLSEVREGGAGDVAVEIDAVYFTYWSTLLRGFYRDLFLDPSTWLLCLAATLVIWYGALRSTVPLLGAPEGGAGGAAAEQPETIKLRMVLLLPVSGSLVLLAMFFFLDLMWPLLFLFCAFAGFVSVAFVVWPLAELLVPSLRLPRTLTCLAPRLDELPGALLLAMPFSTAVVLAWWLTDLWLFTDVIALCIGIVSLSHLRLPDLRLGAILLCVFFVYDIFWVFLSPYLFSGRSVMISVAVNIRSLPMVLIVPHVFLDSPGLLGLGDIILPGLVLAYLFRYDRQHAPLAPHWSGHFRVGLIGYVAGFVVTVLALVLSEGHGQPALLYLVPGVLIPTMLHAVHVGDFSSLWSNGSDASTGRTEGAENELELSTLPDAPHSDAQGLLAEEKHVSDTSNSVV